ncbi:glycosyltransferase family 39 protein [Patescibacteria group bacterium]|nr:glycosyltransferase family 39 protein [Patescibacteria group bacterium]
MKKAHVATLVLTLVIAVKLVFSFSNVPMQITDNERLRQIWLHSQYNLGQGYEFFGNMSDEDLRTFAALEYIRGKDPSVVNFEDPPLVKYLFGVSILAFGNILIVQFVASLVVVFLTYLLARRVAVSTPLNLLPSLVLVFDPLFLERSTSVNLDLPQLVFVLLALSLLTRSRFSRKRLLLLGAAVGLAMATKVVFTGLLLLAFVLVVLVLKRVPQLRHALFSVAASSFSVYLLSYAVFFLFHSPLDFLSLHIKIARLYRSYLPEYPWFEIWRILFLGKWRTWFATPPIQPVAEYWIAWPLAILATFSLLVKKEFRRLPLKPPQILLG